jgi:CHAD domain-containing protein
MAKAKEIEGLNCDAEALSGIRLVLHTRLGEMLDRREAALNFEDIEGVHDMRVASRRLRSAIKDFRDYLGKNSLPKRRLKEVADALGDVRDQDVAIEALEKIRAEATDAEASADVVAGIGQLLKERSALRQSARVKLAFIIAERPLAELRNKFLSRLDSVEDTTRAKGGKRGRGATKDVSFRQAGREVIAGRVVELHELSHSLHHPHNIKPLHRMRIAAKRLRYAMELFAPCWGGTLTSYAHEVSDLQASLGDLHDCDIWIDELGTRLDRHHAESTINLTGEATNQGQVRRAAVWLLDHFTKERGKHFRHALARWEEWETTNFFAQLASILNETPQHTTVAGGARKPPAARAAASTEAHISEPQTNAHDATT